MVPRIQCKTVFLTMLALLLSTPVRGQITPRLRGDIETEVDLALQAFDAGQLDVALQHFQKAVDVAKTFDPQIEHYLLVVRRHADKGDFEAAGEVAEQALQDYPDSGVAHWLHGRMLRKVGRKTDAYEALCKAVELGPTNEASIKELWELLHESHQPEMAISHFSEWVEKWPDNEWLHLYLHLAYKDVGNSRQAAKELRRAIELTPDEWTYATHLSLVKLLTDLESQAAAVAFYEGLAPSSDKAKMVLSQLRVAQGRIDNARDLLTEVASRADMDVQMRYDLAGLLELAGDALRDSDEGLTADQQETLRQLYDEAAEQLRQLQVRLKHAGITDSQYYNVTKDYGQVLVKGGRTEAAIKELRNAHAWWIRTKPEPPTVILFELGVACYQAGQRDRAEEYFRDFLRNLDEAGYRGDPETLEKLGDIYREDGNYRKMAEVFDAVREDPGTAPALPVGLGPASRRNPRAGREQTTDPGTMHLRGQQTP